MSFAQHTARLAAAAALALACAPLGAQTCTTQSKMLSGSRDALAAVVRSLAESVKAGDSAAVSNDAVPELKGNAAAGFLVRSTGEAIAADTLRVTQLYELDANGRSSGDTASADFICQLAGTSSETSFSISGLNPGLYAFAMVEAEGPRPFVLSMLLRQDAGNWKLAGLYPHARTAAGHDGLWFWTDARTKMAAARPNASWLAWLEFGLADTLLRPANFASTTHLEKLRGERTESQPPELRDGLSPEVPYVLHAADNTPYNITELAAEGAPDAKSLVLNIHYRADTLPDPTAGRARNAALVKALVAAHTELRDAFSSASVFANPPNGGPPFATQVLRSEW